MRRLLQSIGIVTIAILLWAAGTAADELADPVVILTDDGKAVGELPAERNYIPFNALRGDARMGVTTQGEIFVALGKKLCSSSDGGGRGPVVICRTGASSGSTRIATARTAG